MANPTSAPWSGDYNVRGAALTFTNADGKAYVYYFCMMDFPSNYWPYDGIQFSYLNVSVIENPGTFNYDANVQYTALNHDLVYYENSYYYCIKDTTGTFDPSSWQSAGSTSYQLNYQMSSTENWPGGGSGASTYTLPLGLFTTDPNYDPSTGPIVSVSVSAQDGTFSTMYGNPNKGKPPVVNLQLRGNGNSPATIMFSSATYICDNPPVFPGFSDSWVIPCINTGSSGGYSNRLNLGTADANNVNPFVLVSKPNQTSPVVAAGCLGIYRNAPSGTTWPSFSITFPGMAANTYQIPNPLSNADSGQLQFYFII